MGRFQKSILTALGLAAPLLLYGSGKPIFYPDDPIRAVPAPAPIEQIEVRKVDQAFDFIVNSIQWQRRPLVQAAGINTIGEVPDSAWFTNRHATKRMSREELQRGPRTGELPAAPFTIIGGKTEGISPGFRMTDAAGSTYFVKVDPMSNPELATAADAIVSRIMYALGYNVPEYDVVLAHMEDFKLSEKAQLTSEDGKPRKMTWTDVKAMVKSIPHYSDGSFRLDASLKIDGDSVGPFRFEQTRTDDPNDLVPHENRRELRALYTFYAWVNNTDARANNTYDTLVKASGGAYIKHFLLDFNAGLGSDGDSPKDARLSHAFMIAPPSEALRSIVTLGLVPRHWEMIRYDMPPAVGNFNSKDFDPDNWYSDYPNPAFLSRTVEDDYWAAKQIMAFTDDDIRAIVEMGRYSDPRVVEYITQTLAERRDKIGQRFLDRVLSIDNFRVENNELHFDDLPAKYDFRTPKSYEVRWLWFDNMSGQRTTMSPNHSAHLPQEAIDSVSGTYFSAVIASTDDSHKTVTLTLRKTAGGYRVVGCSRSQNG